jgi:hypothetical protein
MKKYRLLRAVFALLLVFSLLVLPSCRQLVPYLKDYVAIGEGVTPDTAFSLSENLNADFDERVAGQIEERFEKMDEILASNNVLRALPFVALFARQNSELYYVSDCAQLCYLKFCMDPEKNASYMDEYTRLGALYTDYSSRLIQMYRTIYDSVYRDAVFGNWPETEVELALKLSDSYTEKVTALTKERDELVGKYYKLDQSAADFLTQSAAIYKKIITVNTKIAKELGYDSYGSYAYSQVYSRDYTLSDAQKLHGYVKDYIVPLAKALEKEIQGFASNNSFRKEYSAVLSKDLTSSESFPILESYYGYLYDNPEVFVTQWQDLTVWGEEKSYAAAYTVNFNYYGLPVCYYGNGYTDPFTVIHEQGHFAAALQMPGGYESLDLCEVHSQGNEWLYFSYLKEQSTQKDLYDKIAKVMLLEECLTIIIATACDMFEQEHYKHDNTEHAFDALFKDCLQMLGAYDLLSRNMSIKPEYYWHYAVVANSMYYLSYAVSMIPSIEIYVIAQEQGLQSAADCYNALSGNNASIGFEEALGEAGLSSPLD